jgi:hypothetical protein
VLQQELAKVSEQLKSSNDARFKLKAKLEEAVSCKAALEEAAQTEQQRLSFALEEMRAEMEVLKAIYQEELDAAKRAAAENTRTATMQLGEQAEDALARLSSAHTKLEAAEKRLESLGVDAVSLQVIALYTPCFLSAQLDSSRSVSTRWRWTKRTNSRPSPTASTPPPPACIHCKTVLATPSSTPRSEMNRQTPHTRPPQH